MKFNEYQLSILDNQRPTNKRRKRKGSASGGAANNVQPLPNKKRSPGPATYSLTSQVAVSFLHAYQI